MAITTIYTVDSTDGSATLIIQPRTINGTGGVLRKTDLTLYGNASPNWGERFNENFYRLIENFAVADKTDPAVSGEPKNESDLGIIGYGINAPIQGQLWYNKSDDRLYLQTRPTADLDTLSAIWNKIPTNDDVVALVTGEVGAVFPIPQSDVVDLVTDLAIITSDITNNYNTLNSNKVNRAGGDSISGGLDVGGGLTVSSGNLNIPYGQQIVLGTSHNDTGAIYKHEPASDQSQTRLEIGDNNQSSDYFDVGYDDGSWNSLFQVRGDGTILEAQDATTYASNISILPDDRFLTNKKYVNDRIDAEIAAEFATNPSVASGWILTSSGVVDGVNSQNLNFDLDSSYKSFRLHVEGSIFAPGGTRIPRLQIIGDTAGLISGEYYTQHTPLMFYAVPGVFPDFISSENTVLANTDSIRLFHRKWYQSSVTEMNDEASLNSGGEFSIDIEFKFVNSTLIGTTFSGSVYADPTLFLATSESYRIDGSVRDSTGGLPVTEKISGVRLYVVSGTGIFSNASYSIWGLKG